MLFKTFARFVHGIVKSVQALGRWIFYIRFNWYHFKYAFYKVPLLTKWAKASHFIHVEKNMTMKNLPTIESNTKVPKYQQFVNAILHQIKTGELHEGDKLPSIVESSVDFDLSRDTIGRAYKELYMQGVITSIYRKGYFVANKAIKTQQKRVLFITGKCSTTNQMFYRQLSRELEKYNVQSDCMLCHNSLRYLSNIISKEVGNYHAFIIEPQLLDQHDILEILKQKVVRSKVIFINDSKEALPNTVNHVNFRIDIEFFSILSSLNNDLKRYKTLNLVLPETEYFPAGLISGFFQYCDSQGIHGRLLEEIEEVEKEQGYFVIDEASLFALADRIDRNGWSLGKELGMITLFEKDYLKFMMNGITSINWFNGNLANYLINQIVHDGEMAKPCRAEVRVRNSV